MSVANYYSKYLKYKSKYINLLKNGGAREIDKYSLINLDEIYLSEILDPQHRPSSKLDMFNVLLSEHNHRKSVKNLNNYYVDFLKNYKETNNVKYLTKDELDIYKINAIDSNNIVNCTYLNQLDIDYFSKNLTHIEKTAHTEGHKIIKLIYIMTPDGDIYIIRKEKLPNNQQTNHTTLSRGLKVSSVGWITFEYNTDSKEIKFKLIKIFNNSGHYKPDNLSLLNLLDQLKIMNSNLNVINLEFLSDKTEYNAHEWYEKNKDEYSSKLKKLDYIEYLRYKLSEKFFDLQLNGDYLIYGSLEYKKVDDITDDTDIDSMFIFKKRSDLETFIRENELNLHKLFSLDVGETAEFTKEEIDYFINNKIEILRISGKINGRKVTIKFFSYDNFNTDGESFSRVFIKNKDKRIFGCKLLTGNVKDIKVLLINKTIKPNLWVILDKNYYRTNTDQLVPGLITDSLLNANNYYSLSGYWYKFKYLLFKQYILTSFFDQSKCENPNIENLIDGFVRRFKFSPDYIVKKNSELNEIYKLYSDINCKKHTKDDDILVIDERLFNLVLNNVLISEIIANSCEYNRTKIDFNKDTFKFENSNLVKTGKTTYSSNEDIGIITTTDDKKYFYKLKRPDFESVYTEECGYNKLSKFYDDLLQPKYVNPTKDIIIYPFINNYVLMDKIKIIEELPDEEYNQVITIELKRNEKLLNGFLSTTTDYDTANEKVHKLFFYRLNGDSCRWNEFNYVNIYDRNCIINGIEYNYPQIELIKDYLNPTELNKYIKVLSYTDNHAGNVIVLPGTIEYYNIDYEYASVTHPCLNIAKTIVNDVFSDVLYKQTDIEIKMEEQQYIIKEKQKDGNGTDVEVEITKVKSLYIINHDYTMSNRRKMLLKIKLKTVLGEYLKKLKKHYKESFEEKVGNWEKILRCALFCALVLIPPKIEINQKCGLRLALSYEILDELFYGDVKINQDAYKNTETKIKENTKLLYLNEVINEINYELSLI